MGNVEIDLNNKCRACLSEDEEMHYLFGEFDQGLTLAEILKNNTPFKATPEDGCPYFLCENCTTVLVDFHNFKIVFQENENYIKSLFSHDKCAVISTVEKIEVKEQDLENNENNAAAEEDNINHSQVNIVVETNDNIEDDTQEDVCSFDGHYDEAKHMKFMEDVIFGDGVKSRHLLKEECSLPDDDIKSEPAEVEAYSCEACGDVFLYKEHFEKHMSKHHGLSNIDFDKFRNTTSMKLHQSMEICEEKGELLPNSLELYECKKCKETFKTAEKLKEHLNVHKTHICDQCGVAFVKKSYLLDHYQVHLNGRHYVCQFCGKAFQRRTVLVKHRRIHTHPRQCVCDQCGKCFNDTGTLKTHIKLIHQRVRNFKCSICHLMFPLKATLEKHLRRHVENREKEFTCNICKMAYNDKSSLNRHMFVKHNEKYCKATCNYCDKKYTTKTNLLKHIRKCHPA